jgi:four helix bundle protein
MATIKKFEDLEIWQMAREQANKVYKLTLSENFSRDFALKDQLNRSTGSVMDNIAEGFERFSNKEFIQFLIIAKGSNGEVRSQLYRAYDRKYISEETFLERLNFSNIIGNKTKAFIDYLQSTRIKTKPIKENTLKPSNTEQPTSNFQPPTSNFQ